MSVLMPCPNCQAKLSLPETAAGKKVRCQGCNHVFQVPSDAVVASSPPAVHSPQPPLPAATPPPLANMDHAESVQSGSIPMPLTQGDEQPARKSTQPPTLDNQDDEAGDEKLPRRPRKHTRPKSGTSMVLVLILLLMGGAVLLGLLVICAGFGWFFWSAQEIAPHMAQQKIGPIIEDADEKVVVPLDVQKDFPKVFEDVDNPEQKQEQPGDKLTRIASLANVLNEIKPPKMEGEREERLLPDIVDDVVVARAGRYLLLQIERLNQIAVFDVNEAKLTKFIPLAGPRAKIAAGRDHLMIAYPEDQRLERWSLLDFKKQASVVSPLASKIGTIAMGSGSRCPLYMAGVRDGANAGLLDIEKMTWLKLPFMKRVLPREAHNLRASLDGTVFCLRPDVGGEPHTMAAISLRGSEILWKEAWGMNSSVVVPGPRGKYLYSGGAVCNAELQAQYPNPAPASFAKPFIPAVHGPYYMKLEYRDWDKIGGDVLFFLEGKYDSFGRVDNLDGVSNEQFGYGNNRDHLTHDKRVVFIPRAQLLVSIPKTNNKLQLVHYDPLEALKTAGKDFLIVTSEPEVEAKKGTAYRYQLEAQAREGKIRYQLQAGPEGMKVSPEGLVTWNVPANFSDQPSHIIISISNAQQEIIHTFPIEVSD